MNWKECKNYEPKDEPKDDTKWIRIDYDVIPEKLFKKYGVKPFDIMERKMRDKEGKIWNNITYTDVIKECEKLGCKLPNIREMFLLLEYYKNFYKEVSTHDEEFLGIKELSCNEEVYCEWVYFLPNLAAFRGGYWTSVACSGVFDLILNSAPSYSSTSSSANTPVGRPPFQERKPRWRQL